MTAIPYIVAVHYLIFQHYSTVSTAKSIRLFRGTAVARNMNGITVLQQSEEGSSGSYAVSHDDSLSSEL